MQNTMYVYVFREVSRSEVLNLIQCAKKGAESRSGWWWKCRKEERGKRKSSRGRAAVEKTERLKHTQPGTADKQDRRRDGFSSAFTSESSSLWPSETAVWPMRHQLVEYRWDFERLLGWSLSVDELLGAGRGNRCCGMRPRKWRVLVIRVIDETERAKRVTGEGQRERERRKNHRVDVEVGVASKERLGLNA